MRTISVLDWEPISQKIQDPNLNQMLRIQHHWFCVTYLINQYTVVVQRFFYGEKGQANFRVWASTESVKLCYFLPDSS